MRSMRRFSVLLSFVVVFSACSLIDVSEPSAGNSDVQATGSGSTAEPSPETSVREGDCDSDASEIVLLCQAIDLVHRNYVDDIPDAQLVATGLEGVETLPAGGMAGDLDCSITDDVAAPLCDAIDLADATPEAGVEAALSSIAVGLDPNSAYLDPVALQLAEDDTSGQVEGIGALVSAEDSEAENPEATPCAVLSDTCHLVIVSLFENSPADHRLPFNIY